MLLLWVVCHILVFIMPLYAEVMGVIFDMEVVISKGYTNLWIECDSHLVIQAWFNTSIIP